MYLDLIALISKSRNESPFFYSESSGFREFMGSTFFSVRTTSFCSAIFFKSSIFNISLETVWLSAVLAVLADCDLVMTVIVSVCNPPVSLLSTISQVSSGLSFSIFAIFLKVASTPILSKYLVAYSCYKILRKTGSLRSIFCIAQLVLRHDCRVVYGKLHYLVFSCQLSL